MRALVALLSVIVWVAGGCESTADKHAHNLARETLAQTVEYEDGVRGMHRVLSESYAKDFATLEKAITDVSNVEAKSTALRMADDLADHAVDHPLSSSSFRAFISGALQAVQESQLRAATAVEQLEAEKGKRLAKLEFKETRLQALRTKLERLQAPRTMADEIARLQPLYTAGRDAIDEGKKNR
jgi:Skp family chaperone for outer membrane proteins